MATKQDTKIRARRVIFTMPAIIGCGCLYLVGKFDEWGHESVYRMQRAEDGTWSLLLELQPGHMVHYRYRTDKGDWFTDPVAERYTTNPDGSRFSVLRV